MRIILFSILFLTIIGTITAQKKLRYDADTLRNERRDGENVQFLWPNVVFKQESTTVTNDSSVYYRKRNVMESFGHVKIVDDSTTITSLKLIYNGDERTAILKEKVHYRKGERRMMTDHLNYELDNEIGRYFGGGKLIDTTNTLTSKYGTYFVKQHYAVFYKDVVLVSPDFTLKADTLRYNTTTKVAYTDGPTEIHNSDGTELYANGGVFRTHIDQSSFIEGNVETEDYYLEGDDLFFDELNDYYKGEGNVLLTAKAKDVIITGEEGYYDREKGLSVIYGNPIMKRILQSDTFYIAADTLVAIESEYDSAKRILAYPDIRIFRSNLQGLADSASYFLSDSIIFMYGDPILWTNKNQIRADTIELQIANQTIDRMILHQNSFLVNQDTVGNFNQIKGRLMTAYFDYNIIDKIHVDGNGESIFYIMDDKDSLLIGMNRLFCSSMNIGFENNEIKSITVYTQPEGRIIPPHELSPADERLDGYSWFYDNRPLLRDIYNKPQPIDRSASSIPSSGRSSRSAPPPTNSSGSPGNRRPNPQQPRGNGSILSGKQ
jgi:lipopolysaccharide export system protein LptA